MPYVGTTFAAPRSDVHEQWLRDRWPRRPQLALGWLIGTARPVPVVTVFVDIPPAPVDWLQWPPRHPSTSPGRYSLFAMLAGCCSLPVSPTGSLSRGRGSP